jgi:hypothetical protein
MQRELDLLVAKRTNAYDAVMVFTAYPTKPYLKLFHPRVLGP